MSKLAELKAWYLALPLKYKVALPVVALGGAIFLASVGVNL